MLLTDTLPSNWNERRLKHTVDLRTDRVSEWSVEDNYIGLENIESWTGRLVSFNRFSEPTDDEDVTNTTAGCFEKGDVLFGKLRPYLAKAFVAKTSGVCSTELLVMRPRARFLAEYLLYVLLTRELIGSVDAETFGTKMPRANWSSIGDVFIPVPPRSEQEAIVGYLDHETSKIDTLVAELEDLLKLVAEKRHSTISNAVTRGINPDVTSVDSGVAWIGEVPEHWRVISLKYLSESIQTGPFGSQLHAEEYIDNGIPVINPSHIRDGRITPDRFITVDQETWSGLSRHHLQDGDIVFARRGEMGRCGLVEAHQEGWICGTGSIRVRLSRRLTNPKYINIVLSLRGIKELLELESVGSTLDNLNTEIVGSIYLPVPPLTEQLEIVKHLSHETERLNELTGAIQQTIELLQERRSALIAAAVTGKIRVTE
jgi:type I restriction enzyme, S subunit